MGKTAKWIMEDKVSTFRQRLFVGIVLAKEYCEMINECVEKYKLNESKSDEIVRRLTERLKQTKKDKLNAGRRYRNA